MPNKDKKLCEKHICLLAIFEICSMLVFEKKMLQSMGETRMRSAVSPLCSESPS